MTVTPSPTPIASKPKRWQQRWLVRGIVALLIAILIYALINAVRYANNTRRLERAMAAAAADMPDWQWGKSFETGPFVPGEPNLAADLTTWMLQRGLTESVPRNKPPMWLGLYQQWERTYYTFPSSSLEGVYLAINEQPPARLPVLFLKDLSAALQSPQANADLNELRSWVDRPQGRYDRTLKGLGHLHLLPMAQKTREIVNLLTWDAMIRAEQGKADQALLDLRTCAMLARSFGDDPFLICQLVRIAVGSHGPTKLMRVLAQLERNDPKQLALLQAEYLAEAERPLFLAMVRGQRALMHHDLALLQHDAAQRKRFLDSGFLGVFGQPPFDTGVSWLNRLLDKVTPESFYLPSAAQWPLEQAAMLEYHNSLAAIAQRPETEWLAALKSLPRKEEVPPFCHSLLFNTWMARGSNDESPFTRMVEAVLKYRALLRSAAAACAAERFRLDHDRWPRGFSELTPRYLNAAPTDPFTGKPLFWKALPEGLVIYSVGKDGLDHGGEVLEKEGSPPKDTGVRLWSPTHRRRAPIPYESSEEKQ